MLRAPGGGVFLLTTAQDRPCQVSPSVPGLSSSRKEMYELGSALELYAMVEGRVHDTVFPPEPPAAGVRQRLPEGDGHVRLGLGGLSK